jgi:hypothetical protein
MAKAIFYNNGNLKNIGIGKLDEFMDWQVNTRSGGAGAQDIYALFRAVPWLGRGVSLIAQAIKDFPFQVVRAGDEDAEPIDDSANWTNALGFTENIFDLFYLVAASLTLRGKAYVFPERNRITTKLLKYLNPDTIVPNLDERVGLKDFTRQVGTVRITWQPDELIYFWLPDPQIELGEPLAYPGQAALAAAGVLFSLDGFFKSYTESGLVKAFVAYAKGMPREEQRNKLEDYLTRMMTGIKNLGRIRVLEADAITITPIGEGLKELENVNITQSKREDISTALGIPMSILWSSEAGGLGGGGVTREDTFRFYKQTVVPLFNFIADTFNRQLLTPPGYRIVGKPETLDVFQEDEVQRASSLGALVSAINANPAIARFSMQLLGYELDAAQSAALDELVAEKSARAEQMAQLTAPQTIDVTPEKEKEKKEDDDDETGGEDGDKFKAIERAQFARWVAKRKGAGKAVDALQFKFVYLDATEQALIRAAHNQDAEYPFAIKSVADVYRRFASQLTALVNDAWTHETNIAPQMRVLVKQYVEDSYFDGLIEGGASPDQLSERDKSTISGLIANQETYVSKFAKDVSDARADPAQRDSILKRVAMWAEDVAKAGNAGLVAAQAKRKEKIQWHTANDELTCPVCAPLNGKIVRAGQSFGNDADGNPIYNEPAHFHCRCGTTRYVEDE